MAELTFGKSTLEYEIVRSDRRSTVGIEVAPDSHLIVRAPFDVDESRISEIVCGKASWILARLAKVGLLRQSHTEKEFVSGESFPYLGRLYRLKVVNNGIHPRTKIELKDGRLRVAVNADFEPQERRDAIREALLDWYREHARGVLEAKVNSLAKKIGVAPSGTVLRNQGKRWGSCTRNGVLNLNWRIVMAPNSIVEYVVAHELCHLKIHDHSKYFWQLLAAIVPDYEKRREWLRFNGQTLNL
ncbi:MAG: SprT family zinc-dependent metalloprotease [Acidobacteriota bacterium]